jgi:tRNA threonylcarbamoyladenosine biosynthesis protein TsaB
MDPTGRILLLETSSRSGEVALGDGETIIASRLLAASRRNASDLAPVVDELLKEQGWPPASLRAVAVSLGPGSFTSLRVGLMSAKALAYAVRCDFFGVGTFPVIPEQTQSETDEVFVVSDALQGTVYSASYRRENGNWVEREPLGIRPLDALIASFPPDAILTGPGVESYASRIPSHVKIEPPENRLPRSRTMLRMLRREPDRFRCDPWLTEPIYLRGSSAEEKRRKSGGPI